MKVTIGSVSILAICFANYCSADDEDKANLVTVFIEPVKEESTLQPLKESRQCGGPGDFMEFRMTGCTDDSEICEIPVSGDELLQAEIDYIPVRDIGQLNINAGCVSGDEKIKLFDGPIDNSVVEKGVKYTITIVGTLAEDLIGKTLTCRFEIRDDADDSLRICVETEANMV